MRALVTGGTGFIGAYLLRVLLQKKMTTALLLRPESNTWRIADILSTVKVIQGDLRTLRQVRNDIIDFKPDMVFHLGWYGVGNRYRNDQEQVSNLKSSLDMIQLSAEAGCQVVVGMGSQAEYGPYDRAIRENFPARPTTIYGLTKLGVALLAQELCEKLATRFIWLRLFSAYGPQEGNSWLIPYTILTLLRSEKPSFTSGEQLWDYLYAEDAALAILTAALTPGVKGIYNLGSGETHRIQSVVEAIRDLINPGLALGLGEVSYRPDQVMHLQADISRLREATGWSPKVSLNEGLRRTVDWYRRNLPDINGQA
jgi:UDP-glucose 4-epimerase